MSRGRARTPLEIKRRVSMLQKNTTDKNIAEAFRHNETVKVSSSCIPRRMLEEDKDSIEAASPKAQLKDTAINVPLLKLLEESVSNTTEDSKILITLKLTKGSTLDIMVNNADKVKVELKPNCPISLLYDTTSKKLTKQAFDAVHNDSAKFHYEKSTLDTNSGDMKYILSSLRQNIQHGLIPETPNFSGNPYKLFKKSEDELKDYLGDSKHGEVMYRFVSVIRSCDLSDAEELLKAADGVEGEKDDRRRVRELREVYSKVAEKIHKVLPFSSKVLQKLMDNMVSLVDDLLSETDKSPRLKQSFTSSLETDSKRGVETNIDQLIHYVKHKPNADHLVKTLKNLKEEILNII
eukprot:TRINITY_DN13139_c0_g1_i1.p1 TRINITY_DN13139_c0_g1~~TRINITY_DN13139_c0_g1_i1.p1  ORF type:complete len:350 (-),score=64.41 TRINITY_DN13139_c0_g1_i1:36-1085(-)